MLWLPTVFFALILGGMNAGMWHAAISDTSTAKLVYYIISIGVSGISALVLVAAAYATREIIRSL